MNLAKNKIYYDSKDQKVVTRVLIDLIRAREILWGLVWREIKARYRYAILGFLWAIIEPITLMLLLLFIFSFVFKQRLTISDTIEIPMATQILCGLIFWQYFSTSVSGATLSLIHHQNLVKKVFFPREVVPLSSIIYPMVNLSIGFITLIIIHLFFKGTITINVLWLIIILPILFCLSAGLGLLLSAGYIHFRDIGNMVNVGLTFGFYASPVFYPVEWVKRACENQTLPNWFYHLYILNPIVGILTNLRECILYGKAPQPSFLVYTMCVSIFSLLIGIYIFRKQSPTFSDYM
ncbi:MAG: ABC transporter permease [Candidatus Hydrogenedens sp.]|nr:ABC transporter permease [Candidatus Hydrogenedens sp.]